jgi:hypothetical protein
LGIRRNLGPQRMREQFWLRLVSWLGPQLEGRACLARIRPDRNGQPSDTLFLGAVVQHLRAYSGSFLNKAEGHAWFVGPTSFFKANSNRSISGTFATQISGKARGVSNSLDLDNFNRHIAKVKLGYAF